MQNSRSKRRDRSNCNSSNNSNQFRGTSSKGSRSNGTFRENDVLQSDCRNSNSIFKLIYKNPIVKALYQVNTVEVST